MGNRISEALIIKEIINGNHSKQPEAMESMVDDSDRDV
jgi:hypothetical protein